MMRLSLLFIFAIVSVAPSLAQDDTEPTIREINYGETVQDSITDQALFDWWVFEAFAGDVVIGQMNAEGDLIPLLGLLAPNNEMLARSDVNAVAEAGGVARIEFEIPEDGTYRFVASRAGLENGASTGNYSFTLLLGNDAVPRPNPFLEVVYRCREDEAVNMLQFDALGNTLNENIRITLYGLDGLQPVIRIKNLDDTARCFNEPITDSVEINLPNVETDTTPINTVQFDFSQLETLADVTVQFGAVEGTSGRYIAVIEGLGIDEYGEREFLGFQAGPRAQNEAFLIYMIGAEGTRLDPYIRLDLGDEQVYTCDDAGLRECADVPAIDGYGLQFEDGRRIIGDRFDAGMYITPQDTDSQLVQFSARNPSTRGAYSLIIIGTLADEADSE